MKFYLDVTPQTTPPLHQVIMAIARARNSDWKLHFETTRIFVTCVHQPRDIGELKWQEVGKNIQ